MGVTPSRANSVEGYTLDFPTPRGCHQQCRQRPQRWSGRSGFTLIELLIVISIIGVLAGFLFVNFASVRERGRDARRKSDLNALKTALRLYYNDYQRYPADDSNGGIMGCGATGDQLCTWGQIFGSATVTYMRLPLDPINEGIYQYKYQLFGSEEGYRITTYLENNSDPASAQSQRDCGVEEVAITVNLYMACSLAL